MTRFQLPASDGCHCHEGRPEPASQHHGGTASASSLKTGHDGKGLRLEMDTLALQMLMMVRGINSYNL